MNRWAWQATVRGVAKIGHDLVIKTTKHTLKKTMQLLNM